MALQNPDGTFNGSAVMAELTGLSEEGVRWAWQRMVQLVREEGMAKAEARALVAKEIQRRPWERDTLV